MESIQQSVVKKLGKMKCAAHYESFLYHDNEYLYKIYRSLGPVELVNKKEKVSILADGKKLDNVILPRLEVKEKCFFVGYGMDYVKNATNLYDYFDKCDDINELLGIVYNISLTLRNIHSDPRNIVVADLHFDNILVDDKGEHYFIDFDGSKIGDIPNECIPGLLKKYIDDYNINLTTMSELTDRFCLVLSLLDRLIAKFRIDDEYDYDKNAEKFKTLANLKFLWQKLQEHKKYIFDVPYVDELIDKEDIGKALLLK